MNQKLNVLLSNLVLEYHKLQNFHWYAKGKDFFQVHAKLEELYDHINEAVDEVAESMLMIHVDPAASMKEFLEFATIQEASTRNIQSNEIFPEVLKDFELLLKDVKEIKKEADEKEEYIISALMDDYIKEFSKSVWMIQAFLEKN